MPLSAAIFLAKGEANILEPAEVTATGADAVAGAIEEAATATGSDEATTGAEAGAGAPESKADTSVPCGPIMANTLSTGADSPA